MYQFKYMLKRELTSFAINFNTSHVSVQVESNSSSYNCGDNFNTSHVSVQAYPYILYLHIKIIFQYISCISSSLHIFNSL